MQKELTANISSVSSLKPQLATETVDGTGVDLAGFRSAGVVIDVGTFAGTTPAATIQIQDSADNETFAEVAATNLAGGAIPAMSTTTDVAIIERGYLGTKRYIRVAVTAISGTSASLPISAIVVRGDSRTLPIT